MISKTRVFAVWTALIQCQGKLQGFKGDYAMLLLTRCTLTADVIDLLCDLSIWLRFFRGSLQLIHSYLDFGRCFIRALKTDPFWENYKLLMVWRLSLPLKPKWQALDNVLTETEKQKPEVESYHATLLQLNKIMQIALLDDVLSTTSALCLLLQSDKKFWGS